MKTERIVMTIQVQDDGSTIIKDLYPLISCRNCKYFIAQELDWDLCRLHHTRVISDEYCSFAREKDNAS